MWACARQLRRQCRRARWGMMGGLTVMSLVSPLAGGADEVGTEIEVRAPLESRLPPVGLRVLEPSPSPSPRRHLQVAEAVPRAGAADRAPGRSRSIRRRAACAGGAVAIAGGLIARWSKKKADRAYERYLHSASVRRQERAFDRSRRYDRITGGAFAAMEVGVVLAAYFTFY